MYTEGPGEVSAWGSVGRTTCETAPARHRVPLPAGQRRAQLNHLTRRCDFPRLAQDAHPDGRIGALSGRMACTAERARAARPETKPRARGGFGVTTIDFRTDPVTARRHRVVSLVTHADIQDIVWADDETGCYGVRGRDAKGKRIVVEQSGPIRIVSARK